MIEWTRVRLTQWGRYCRGVARTGYPTASAFVRANEGDRCAHVGEEMPWDIEEVDRCIGRMSRELATVIQQTYIHRGPLWSKALKLGVSRETFKRRLWIAETQIDKMLGQLDGSSTQIQQGGTRGGSAGPTAKDSRRQDTDQRGRVAEVPDAGLRPGLGVRAR